MMGRNAVLALVATVALATGVHGSESVSGTSAVAFSAGLEASTANPIRRVVSLLQNMAKKITSEAESEAALYQKYECWCKTSGGDLQQSISENNAKIPQVQSDIEAAEASKKALEGELKEHQEGRAAAKEAQAKATALREKEAAAYAKESSSLKSYIGALGKAIPAIETGMTGFLQTTAASLIRRVAVSDVDLSDFDREALTSFLAGGSAGANRYVPQSGQIVGILKTMSDEFEKDLGDLTSQEEEAKKTYNEMMTALGKEIAAHTEAIEKKTQRVGELGVAIVNMKDDLSDSEAALVSDTKFLQDLEKNCATKKAEWDERTATRAQELSAIHDTINILNDDDALELFKKTLPSPSLLQIRQRAYNTRQHALEIVRHLQAAKSPHRPNFDLIALALSGKKPDFTSVIKMIDDLVALLAKEGADDENKKEYCTSQLDQVEDTVKEKQHQIEDLEASIAAKEETVKTLASELKTLEAGIKDLDKQVAEATEQRKKEHGEFTELMSSNSAAKELIGFAKNRLNKFYNKGLYVAPPKRTLTAEETIYSSMGGELEATPAPGGIAGTGVTALVQLGSHNSVLDAPPPPPETYGAYGKKTEETGGVMAMLDLLVKDLDKEMTEATVEEEHAQEAYEGLMSDSAEKRAADSKSITEKESAKADTQAMAEAEEEQKAATTKEYLAAGEYGQQLHAECDWLLQNVDLRRQARADEVDALKRAKAVLSGADFS